MYNTFSFDPWHLSGTTTTMKFVSICCIYFAVRISEQVHTNGKSRLCLDNEMDSEAESLS